MLGSCSRIKSFCREDISLIEGYDRAMKDKSNTKYVCHHRLETHTRNGNLRKVSLSMQELIDKGLYYDRPAKELIILTNSEHISLHNTVRPITDSLRENMSKALYKYYDENGTRSGIVFTEEHCRHISEGKKGKPSPKRGIPVSEEQKRKQSLAMKGRPSPFKGKKRSKEFCKKISDTHWDTSGNKNPAHIISVLRKWYIKKYGEISQKDFLKYYHENKEKLLKIYKRLEKD